MKVLGVDVGGTNVDVVIFDSDTGEFRHVDTIKTSEVISDFSAYVCRIAGKLGVRSIGIGAAVWIRNSKPVFAPNLSEFSQLGKELDCLNKNVKVVLENDANCFALFASRTLKVKNLLGITVGTGVGSGIVAEGKIYRGMGMAGEIGHVVVSEGGRQCGCGERGHLEAYFGGRAFTYEGKDVKELVKTGAIYVTEGFRYFCIAVANAVRLLDPEVVALGGRIGMNLDTEIVKTGINRYLPGYYSTEVVAVKDELAVAKGACFACLERSLE